MRLACFGLSGLLNGVNTSASLTRSLFNSSRGGRPTETAVSGLGMRMFNDPDFTDVVAFAPVRSRFFGSIPSQFEPAVGQCL